jgi:hypothetical protein
MDALITHFQTWAIAYACGAVVLLPVLFFTRRYSVPAILFAIETLIYFAVAHTVMWCIVTMATWFKNNSTMRALEKDGTMRDVADWSIPYLQFWEKELYNPQWVMYLEGVFAVLIILAVFRYRPLKVHNPHKRRYDDAGKLITKGSPKGKGYSYSKPGAGPSRGRR